MFNLVQCILPSISDFQWKLRCYCAYQRYCQLEYDDRLPIPDIWDIENSQTVATFLNKGIDDNENAIILHDDDVYWATDDSILIQLNNRVLKYSQSDLASIPNKQIHSIFHTCIYNGLQVDSIQLS